jgi:hypothetical protein
MDVFVNLNQNCLHSFRNKEQYGEWGSTFSNSFESVSLSKDFGGTQETIDFDVKAGDLVFVVWAEWSDGDSFGRSVNGRVDVCGIFLDSHKAVTLQTALRNKNTKDEDWHVKYQSESGVEMSYYVPWMGYFARLGKVHIDLAIVEE